MWLVFLRNDRVGWFLFKQKWKKNRDVASTLEEQWKQLQVESSVD